MQSSQGAGHSLVVECQTLKTCRPAKAASFVLEVPGMVIYNDPVGGRAAYAEPGAPGLVLVCHGHEDHFNAILQPK